MASKTLIAEALRLYKKLGGNTSKILGTRSNISFLGRGDNPESMVEMSINPEALGIVKKDTVLPEFDSAMGYLTSGKLNDMQASRLVENLRTVDSFYNPPPGPANITDLATRTRNLDKEGLMSLRDDFDLDQGLDDLDNLNLGSKKGDVVSKQLKIMRLAEDIQPGLFEKLTDMQLEIITKYGDVIDDNLLKQIGSGNFLMVGNGLNKKSMAYVGNVAAFIKKCMENTNVGYNIFNYSDKPDFDMKKLVLIIEKKMNIKIPNFKIPYFLGILFGYLFDLFSILYTFVVNVSPRVAVRS